MTDLELGWVAGFLEGEGHFGSTHQTKLRVNQVQREPLERLAEMAGGRLNGPYYQSGSQPYHTWCLHGAPAVTLAGRLWPIMSPRRRGQIEAMIERHWAHLFSANDNDARSAAA